MVCLKDRAEIYRLGLIVGLFCKSDVLNWVDTTIESESNVDYALIEVSLNSSKNNEDVACILKNVRGKSDSKTVANIIIGLLAQKFDENHDIGSEIASILKRLTQNIDSGVLESEVMSKINNIDDGFYLAEQNIYGYVKDMISELNDFLKDYTKYAEL
ncbi:MAG: hypothetical protein N3B21_11925 [Clostridia bacterium]|nr:hypothetical protein [Clostridia bacterium]